MNDKVITKEEFCGLYKKIDGVAVDYAQTLGAAERTGFDDKSNFPVFVNFQEKSLSECMANNRAAVLSSATLRRWIQAGRYSGSELSLSKLRESGLIDERATLIMVYDDDVYSYSVEKDEELGVLYTLYYRLGKQSLATRLQVIEPQSFFFAVPFGKPYFGAEEAENEESECVKEDMVAENAVDDVIFGGEDEKECGKWVNENPTDCATYTVDSSTGSTSENAEEKENNTEEPHPEPEKKKYGMLNKPTLILVVDFQEEKLINLLKTEPGENNDWLDYLLPERNETRCFVAVVDVNASKIIVSKEKNDFNAYTDSKTRIVSRVCRLTTRKSGNRKNWVSVIRENEDELLNRSANQYVVFFSDHEGGYGEDDDWFENVLKSKCGIYGLFRDPAGNMSVSQQKNKIEGFCRDTSKKIKS